MGKIFAFIFYFFPTRFKKLFKENYLQANPNGSHKDIKIAFLNLGSIIAELPYVWFNPRAIYKVKGKFEYDNNGIILIGLHWGGFELIPRFITAKNHNFTAMYRKPHLQILDNVVLNIRQSQKVNILPANQAGVIGIIKKLKSKQIIGLLPDQVPQGDTGIWVPFFNKIAYTGILTHKLYALYNTKTCICAMKQIKGGWEFIQKNIYLTDNEEKNCIILNKSIEDIIKIDMKQYLWGYNRYKSPLGAKNNIY